MGWGGNSADLCWNSAKFWIIPANLERNSAKLDMYSAKLIMNSAKLLFSTYI